jgi:hypothetical protein
MGADMSIGPTGLCLRLEMPSVKKSIPCYLEISENNQIFRKSYLIQFKSEKYKIYQNVQKKQNLSI